MVFDVRVIFYVLVVLIVLVGWNIMVFGVECEIVRCLIGWWVGLFLFRLIELWVIM